MSAHKGLVMVVLRRVWKRLSLWKKLGGKFRTLLLYLLIAVRSLYAQKWTDTSILTVEEPIEKVIEAIRDGKLDCFN